MATLSLSDSAAPGITPASPYPPVFDGVSVNPLPKTLPTDWCRDAQPAKGAARTLHPPNTSTTVGDKELRTRQSLRDHCGSHKEMSQGPEKKKPCSGIYPTPHLPGTACLPEGHH